MLKKNLFILFIILVNRRIFILFVIYYRVIHFKLIYKCEGYYKFVIQAINIDSLIYILSKIVIKYICQNIFNLKRNIFYISCINRSIINNI